MNPRMLITTILLVLVVSAIEIGASALFESDMTLRVWMIAIFTLICVHHFSVARMPAVDIQYTHTANKE